MTPLVVTLRGMASTGGKTMPANGDKTFIRDYETKKPRFNTFAFHGIFLSKFIILFKILLVQ